jgi:hypothetical protein
VLAGEGVESVPWITLCSLAGYLRYRQGRPIIRATRTLRIRQGHGLNRSTAPTISPLPTNLSYANSEPVFMSFRGP